MTYNISIRDFMREERSRAVINEVLRHSPHVVAFQEMTPEYYDLLKKDKAFSLQYRLVPETEKAVRGKLVIALSSEIRDYADQHVKLPGRMGRYAQIMRFRFIPREMAEGHLIQIVNLHLESYLEDGPIRVKQLKAIRPYLKKPSIILGDFNFGDGPEAKPEKEALPDGYQDSWQLIYGSKPGYTWNQEENPLSDLFKFDGEKSRRIDFILFNADEWLVEHVQLAGTKKVLKYKDEPIPPSDHYAVVADFQVPAVTEPAGPLP